jgi:uncharacterized Zn-finger protein
MRRWSRPERSRIGYTARQFTLGEGLKVPAVESTPRTLLQPNAQNQYRVSRRDLPLSCPMPQMYLWNSHPRVYLPIEPTGWAKCPYCGAEYTLEK